MSADTRPKPKLHTARVELTLAQNDSYPLRSVPLKPDPIQQVSEVFALLDVDQSEHLEVIMDLVPMTRAAARKRRRDSVKELQAERGGKGGVFNDLLNPANAARAGNVFDQLLNPGAATRSGGKPLNMSQPPGIARLDKLREERLLSESLADPEPHFYFQLLIRATSENKQRAAALIQASLAAFEQFGGHNELKVVGIRLPFGFLSADSIFRRHAFDWRIDGWYFRQRKHSVVGVSEIAGLMKPATVHCARDNVVRTGGTLPPAPRDLVTYDLDNPRADLFLVGAVKGKGAKGERVVGVSLEDTLFSYTPGRSGFGKSESSLARFAAVSRAGRASTLFLDPHADALERVKPYLREQSHRIIELSTAPRTDGARTQIGWNPFAKAFLNGPDAVATQTDLVVNSIAAAMQWGNSTAPRTLAITRNSVQALMELSRLLPADAAPTIFQIATLLTDDDWRDAVVPRMSPVLRRYWEKTFPKLSDEAQGPLANFISRLYSNHRVAALLGSSISNYNARQAIDSGAIILVRLNGKNDIDQLMASLVVWDLKAAVMSRTDTPPDQRREIHAWFDEVQDYDGAIRGQISDILEQTRKFGMRLHLLNQQPSSLQKKTLSATLTNRSHLFATAVNAESARMLASNMSPTMSPAVIQDTPKYNFVSQVTINGELSSPFRCRGIGLEEAFGAMPPASVAATVQQEIDANSGRRSIYETLAAQETLDERILEHLGATHGRAATQEPAAPRRRGGATMPMRTGLSLVSGPTDPRAGSDPSGASDLRPPSDEGEDDRPYSPHHIRRNP